MKLPAHPRGGVQIGVSDVLAWRDCAARMQFGMRRHEGREAPEAQSPAAAYGSAVHLCLELLDNGETPEQAAQAAFARYKQWLEPDDLALLHGDMQRYLEREMLGVRTLLNEGEISIPLFEHPQVGQVWFRARIDRLYQSLIDPGHLIHIDFKSSKHAKSHDEVVKDIQIWSYALTIREWFTDLYPEVEEVRLEQVYDQLRYGQIPVPPKTPQQLARIRDWLIKAITAVIEDEEMAPTFNQWCSWCFPAGTAVVTEGGVLRPIEELEVGDLTLTHRGRFMPVRATSSRRAERLLKVRLSGGGEIICTPEHLLLATPKADLRTIDKARLGGEARRDFPPPGYFRVRGVGRGLWISEHSTERTWVEAERIAPGDLLWGRIPPERPQPLCDDELRILGWYLAEGHAGARSVSFSLHQKEVPYQEEIIDLLQRVFGARHLDIQQHENRWQLYLHDHHASAWFRYFGGCGAAQKRIHPLVFSPRTLMPLVVSAWRGDGTEPHPERSQLSYTSSSRTLAYQIQTALMAYGIPGRMALRKGATYHRSATEMGFRRDAYNVVLSGSAAAEFAQHLQKPIGQSRFTQAPSIALLGPWTAQCVMAVEPAQGAEVYNIEVGQDESFVLADQVAVHNCPLRFDCPVVRHDLTDWARTKIAALMPREEKLNKDGSVSKRPGKVKLDPERIGDYVALLPDVKRAATVLKSFDEEVSGVLKQMPADRLAELGKRRTERTQRSFDVEAKRRLIDEFGLDTALMLFDLSFASVERFFGKKSDEAEAVASLAETLPSYAVIEDL